MKINDLFELIPNIYYIAGDKGGRNRINYADIVEIPEGVNWVKENDFIITTGYFLSNNLEAFKIFIEKLISSKAAGLGIKLGKHVTNIPSEITYICENKGFPLISIPLYFSYRDIIQPINHTIENDQLQDYPIETLDLNSFLLKLITTESNNELLIESKCAQFNITYSKPRFLCIFNYGKYNINIKSIINNNQIIEHLKEHHIKFIHNNMKEEIIFIYTHEKNHSPQCTGINLLYFLNSILGKTEITLGVSSVFFNLSHISTAYNQATISLNLGPKLEKDSCLYLYDDIAIFKFILDNINNPTLYNFYNRTLLFIKKFDEANNSQYYESLVQLIENDFNINIAVSKMFIHRNTMYMRIKKINELLSFDITEAKYKQMLQIALQYEKILTI